MDTLLRVKDFLNQGWVGVLAGVITTLISVLLVKKDKVNISYCISDTRIIGPRADNLPGEFSVEYNGKTVQKLTSSDVVIWNDGSTGIVRQQFPDSDTLKVRVEDGEILSASIVSKTNAKNAAVLQYVAGAGELGVDFQFFQQQDGISVNVIHTGDVGKLRIEGTIVGAKDAIKDRGDIPRAHYRSSTKSTLDPMEKLLETIDTVAGSRVLKSIPFIFFTTVFVMVVVRGDDFVKAMLDPNQALNKPQNAKLMVLVVSGLATFMAAAGLARNSPKIPQSLYLNR